MSVTPAIAPQVPTYATYTPYITAAEFMAEPTGVDVSQLVPRGQPPAQMAALTRVIARASGAADGICRKPLSATTDIQSGTYRVRRDGTVWVPADFYPLIMVLDVKVGRGPADAKSLTDLSGVRVGKKVAKIPLRGCGPRSGYPGGYGLDVYVEMTYVNGFAHTLTGGTTTVGLSQLLLQGALGVVPGLPMTVYDAANTESIMVGPSYALGSATIPLVSPLQYPHGPGVSVSALPPTARDAVILLTTARIKNRGASAVVMNSVKGQPTQTQKTTPGQSTEFAEAKAALLRLRRAV